MLASFRSALLMCAALTLTTIAPAKAGPSAEPLVSVANATLSKVAIPDLLDPNGEPKLSQPDAVEVETPTTDDQTADGDADKPAIKPDGDLAAMVAQLRRSEAGSPSSNASLPASISNPRASRSPASSRSAR